jgi:opacity protein-like surface antigen
VQIAGLALLLLVTAPAPALADALYIGAGVYKADLDLAITSEDDVTPAGFIGYQFLDSNFLMLSAELGYYDLGESSGTVAEVPYSVDASALSLAGVAYVPIGPFVEVYAKAGAAMIDVESRIADERSSDNDMEFFGGIGVALDIFDTIDIYAEYLQFDNRIDSQMLGVGIRLDFF